MNPILPPRPEVVAALLHPGSPLKHRLSGAVRLVERADRIRTKLESGWLGPGSPHAWVRVREGTTLAIKVGDHIYREYGDGPRVADLWRDYELPAPLHHVPTLAARQALEVMEQQGGFRFYPRQALVTLAVAATPGALVAAETGAGKTLMGIALTYIHRPPTTLILVPQGVLQQWQEQFAKFWPGQEIRRLAAGDIGRGVVSPGIWLSYHHEFLLNHGGLARQLDPQAFDQVVVDEAHLLQNPDTLMGDALWRLQPRWRYALTATPVPNRLRDIYPLCRWLRPEVEYHYNNQAEYILHADGRRVPVDPVEPLSPALFAAELSPVVAAVRKTDLRPDLPPCHVRIVRHELSPEQRKTYSFYENEWTLPRGDGGTIARVRLNHLRNVCARGGIQKNEALVRRILDLVGSGEQVVAACSRTLQSTWLETRVAPHLDCPVARIDSTIPAGCHAVQARVFREGQAQVMFIGARCAYGFNWNNCAWLLIGSPEWGLGTILQVLGRVWRLDSPRPVHCEIHVCAGTVEERMIRTVALKESAATAVLYGSACSLLLEPASVDALRH